MWKSFILINRNVLNDYQEITITVILKNIVILKSISRY